jgi:hypothetical protein
VEVWCNHLDRYVAFEVLVSSLEDRSHTTRANQPLNSVPAGEGSPDQQL